MRVPDHTRQFLRLNLTEGEEHYLITRAGPSIGCCHLLAFIRFGPGGDGMGLDAGACASLRETLRRTRGPCPRGRVSASRGVCFRLTLAAPLFLPLQRGSFGHPGLAPGDDGMKGRTRH